MNTFQKLMKYVLYALGIIVGFPFLAYIVINCLALGLMIPQLSILAVLLITISLIICQTAKNKKLKEENENLKKKANERERRVHIEKIVKESDAKRGR